MNEGTGQIALAIPNADQRCYQVVISSLAATLAHNIGAPIQDIIDIAFQKAEEVLQEGNFKYKQVQVPDARKVREALASVDWSKEKWRDHPETESDFLESL